VYEHYVYVPYADAGMDGFASALVREKNTHNRIIGHHTLIPRGGLSATPLSAVGYKDRLYVCIHGASKHAGIGVWHTQTEGRGGTVTKNRHTIRGEELAAELVRLGLANKSISLRLWTCWGGGKANEDRGTIEPGDDDRTSFALRVASGLKAAGRKSIEVVGYRHLVFLGAKKLTDNNGHKSLQKTFGSTDFVNVSEENKVRIQVKAI
jgi:hypothetical protein